MNLNEFLLDCLQFYADTVKQMAISQLAIGSPLRTLCLLIAKKPEEVFSNNIRAGGNMHGVMHMPQPAEVIACVSLLF